MPVTRSNAFQPHGPPLTPGEYRLLVEHAPVMIWRSGTDAACSYFNAPWLEFTGRTLEQELGDGWTTGIHPQDRARCLDVYRTHFDRREPFERDYRLRRRDGEYRWIVDRGVPATDDDGTFLGFIGSCVDVQERKAFDESRVAFLEMLAHEQRSPLMASKLYLEALERKAAKGEPIEPRTLARISAQLDRLTRLVNDLTESARLEQEIPVRLAPERTDLGDIVDRVVALHEHKLRQKITADRGHRISVSRPGTSLPLHADARRLVDAFEQLLDNAVKYSPRGGPIDIDIAAHAGGYRVTITDSGIGVPRAELTSLTRRFYRASNASREQFPGLGLGLAVSREIIERHGGRLRFASELGRSTTVEVLLPSDLAQP